MSVTGAPYTTVRKKPIPQKRLQKQRNDSDDPYRTTTQQPQVPPRPNRGRGPPKARQPAPPVPSEPELAYDEANNFEEPPPSRYPNRPPVPVPDDQEDYEEPDLTVLGPPPPARPSRPKPNVPNSNPQKSTTPISRRPQPQPPSDEEDNYIEPQEDCPLTPPEKPPRVATTPTTPLTTMMSMENKPTPPPISRIPKKTQEVLEEQPNYEEPNAEITPSRPGKKEPVQEETYEQPDGTVQESTYEACNNDDNLIQEDEYEVPEVDTECNENYLDITGGETFTSPPIPERPVTKPVQSSGRTQGTKFESRPPKPAVQYEEQEQYEIPESDPVVRKSTKTYTSVLPKPTTNGTSHDPPAIPRQRQKLPPPPSSAPPPAVASPRSPAPAPTPAAAEQPKQGDAFEASLLQQRWYHGNITRRAAAEQLARHGVNGMYLIRKSSQGDSQPYTLQIYFNGKDYNLPVKKIDGKYSVGNNSSTFGSLIEMVNVFKSSTLLLNQDTETKLVNSMPKQ